MLVVFIQMIYTKSGFCPQSQQNAKVKETAESGGFFCKLQNTHLPAKHMSLKNLVTIDKVQ